jgi:HAMP domain-containing protein
MKLDVYLKTVLTVIAAALVVIAIHLSAERLSPSAAQAQSRNDDAAMDPSASPPSTPTLDSVASRVSALERTQKEQGQRLEALRAAMQSTVTQPAHRGFFPDGNWATIHWDPDIPPPSGG